MDERRSMWATIIGFAGIAVGTALSGATEEPRRPAVNVLRGGGWGWETDASFCTQKRRGRNWWVGAGAGPSRPVPSAPTLRLPEATVSAKAGGGSLENWEMRPRRGRVRAGRPPLAD